MNNKKDNKEFVMPNGFKITGNINYYAKRRLEGIAAELEEIPHVGHSVGGNVYYGRAEKSTPAKDGKLVRMLAQDIASYRDRKHVESIE